MVTSDFRPEGEIWPIRACTMKNMQYNKDERPRGSRFEIYNFDTSCYRAPMQKRSIVIV